MAPRGGDGRAVIGVPFSTLELFRQSNGSRDSRIPKEETADQHVVVGGALYSPPIPVAWGANRLDLFARGSDSALWYGLFRGSTPNDST